MLLTSQTEHAGEYALHLADNDEGRPLSQKADYVLLQADAPLLLELCSCEAMVSSPISPSKREPSTLRSKMRRRHCAVARLSDSLKTVIPSTCRVRKIK
jgi:hypothetical protein